jgi:hypothetical protein
MPQLLRSMPYGHVESLPKGHMASLPNSERARRTVSEKDNTSPEARIAQEMVAVNPSCKNGQT